MEILLKKLTLNNFKGLKFLEIDFKKKTFIYGANAAGKTTIFDAFTWLLFSKDSQGNTNFEIKTLDKNNNIINHLEHSVEGVLDIDGTDISLKKVHLQKWTKKKGSSVPTLEGTVNSFFWNNVPLKEKEYQEKLRNLIEPDLFSLLSNPVKFNLLNWKDKRDILFKMAGDISISEVVSQNKKLEPLLEILSSKSLEEFKKEILSKKSKLKKEMETITPRIDEVDRSVVDVGQLVDVEPLKQRLEEIDTLLLDNQKAFNEYEKSQWGIKNQITSLNQQIFDIKANILRKNKQRESDKFDRILEIETQIRNVNGRLEIIFGDIKRDQDYLELENSLLQSLRKEAIAKKSELFVFDENNCICPVCKRKFEETDIEAKKAELQTNFNISRAKAVEQITARGITTKDGISQIEDRIKKSEAESDILKSKLAELQSELDLVKSTPTLIEEASVSDIESKVKELENLLVPFSNKEAELQRDILTSEKQKLTSELEDARKKALLVDSNNKARERIAELEQEERDIAQTIARLEGQEFLLEEFTRNKINITEEKINGLFKLAKFKMFHLQVNGGVAECCETTYLGVPYSDLNTAGRINVGLDIINALTKFYDITAPVFIDNRESITEIIDTESQVVNLIVSESDRFLRIEG